MKFKLYGFIGEKPVLVTNSVELTSAATFDEKVDLQDNGKTRFECKIVENLAPGVKNKFYDLFFPRAKLRLELFNYKEELENSIDLIILDYKPTFYEKNTEVSVAAEDQASVLLSKTAIGLTLDETNDLRHLVYKVMGNGYLNANYASAYSKISAEEMFIVPYDNRKVEGFPRSAMQTLFFTEGKDLRIRLARSRIPEAWLKGEIHFRIVHPETVKFKIGISYDVNVVSSHVYNTFIDYQTNTEGVIHLDWDNPIDSNFISLKFIKEPNQIYRLDENSCYLTDIYYYNDLNVIEENVWSLDNNFKDSDFYNPFTKIATPMKMTLQLSNSNVYNGLIELSKMFNARITFDYINKKINFIPVKDNTYKGYRLNPHFNITEFNRKETTDDFTTILYVKGRQNEDESFVNLIPDIPLPWVNFFTEQLKNNWAEFDTYTEKGYQNIVDTYFKTGSKFCSVSEYNLYKDKINEFAAICDLVPNMDNTIYDISYFRNINAISESKYAKFLNLVYNDLRKVNTEIQLYSRVSHYLKSRLTEIESEIDFISRNIVTEEQYKLKQEEHLSKETVHSVKAIYQKRIQESILTIDKWYKDLDSLFGVDITKVNSTELILTDNERLKQIDTVVELYAMLYGLGHLLESGIGFNSPVLCEKHNQIKKQILAKTQELSSLTKRIADIEIILQDTSLSNRTRTIYEVERSGLRNNIANIERAIGKTVDGKLIHTGYLLILDAYYKRVQLSVDALSRETKSVGIEYLLRSPLNPDNALGRKLKILSDINNEFSQYFTEGYYENEDETTSIGLAQQAFLTKEMVNHPTVSYNIHIIDLSSLKDYQFLSINIGDRIILDDNRLYKEYNPKYQNFLTITGISRELRDDSRTQLYVNKQDDDNRTLQKLFLNLVQR